MKNTPDEWCSRKPLAPVLHKFNDGLMDRYLYTGTHEAIIPDEMFKVVQEGTQKRSCALEHKFANGMTF